MFFESEILGAHWGHIPLQQQQVITQNIDFVRGYFAYQKPIENVIHPHFSEAL